MVNASDGPITTHHTHQPFGTKQKISSRQGQIFFFSSFYFNAGIHSVQLGWITELLLWNSLVLAQFREPWVVDIINVKHWWGFFRLRIMLAPLKKQGQDTDERREATG